MPILANKILNIPLNKINEFGSAISLGHKNILAQESLILYYQSLIIKIKKSRLCYNL